MRIVGVDLDRAPISDVFRWRKAVSSLGLEALELKSDDYPGGFSVLSEGLKKIWTLSRLDFPFVFVDHRVELLDNPLKLAQSVGPRLALCNFQRLPEFYPQSKSAQRELCSCYRFQELKHNFPSLAVQLVNDNQLYRQMMDRFSTYVSPQFRFTLPGDPANSVLYEACRFFRHHYLDAQFSHAWNCALSTVSRVRKKLVYACGDDGKEFKVSAVRHGSFF